VGSVGKEDVKIILQGIGVWNVSYGKKQFRFRRSRNYLNLISRINEYKGRG